MGVMATPAPAPARADRPPLAPSQPLLRAESLQRRYGGRAVIDVAELEVAAGEVLAILGPNGAGKSTLFRLLLLIEKPDAGRILFEGRAVQPGDRAVSRRLAGVFQRPHLFTGSVRENVGYGLRVRGVSRPERARRVADALAWLGLEAHAGAPVHALSGGEAQRVALARALALEPELLLLDEPTANLDITVRRRFREDLERLARTHARAAILITHDPGDAFALADRIAVLHEGRIVQVGAPDELVLHPATPFVAAFTGAELLLDGSVSGKEDGLVLVELKGGTRLVVAEAAQGGVALGARVHVAYRPEDVLLAAADAAETSAQNRFLLRVTALNPAGGLVRVRLQGDATSLAAGVALTALVTRRGADTLGLAPGRDVLAQLKATALRAFAAPR
ncbi:MAG: ABC transporter ATP-binding protein [Gemmatimonadetes bacterium]|nr:ABC transporter ATP-binding protein [Gemmatimonadota bacterium]